MVTVPLRTASGKPIGLQLIAAPFNEQTCLRAARALEAMGITDARVAECSMINLDNVDRPAILAEVTAAFYQYEEALVSNNIEALDALFWHDPRTVRLGAGENLYGIGRSALSRRPPRRRSGPRSAPYHHYHLWRGYGGVQHRVYPRRQRRLGRQQQTWVRVFPTAGGLSPPRSV